MECVGHHIMGFYLSNSQTLQAGGVRVSHLLYGQFTEKSHKVLIWDLHDLLFISTIYLVVSTCKKATFTSLLIRAATGSKL